MRKRITLALLSMLLVPFGMMAQNVTVHPGNGNMLPALKTGDTDTFFGWNGYATWKHEQLSLTLTTGDSDNNSGTDADGNLARPANDIFVSADGKYLQIGKGGQRSAFNTYLTVSLPKGYRFTGYTIKFHRIARPDNDGVPSSVNNYNGIISFGETDNTFAFTNVRGTIQTGIGTNYTTSYTITRESDEMENVLYFKLGTDPAVNYRAFIQLDHVEFYFTAENNYTPLIPAPNVTNRSAVDIPFTTSKMDYGQLKRYDINGNEVTSGGRISYNGTIHDMNANLILYEMGSVEEVANNGFDGTAGNIVKYDEGSISQAGDYFKLDASNPKTANIEKVTIDGEEKDAAIYYIETPVWAVNTASTKKNKNPIGYRITDASFECTSGNLKFPAVFKIQYESTGHTGANADQNGTYGLNFYNNQLRYNWNYQTEWRIDDDGYIYVGNSYLTVAETSGYISYSYDYTLTTTTDKSQAFKFEITSDNQIRLKDYTSYYIGWYETTWNGITRYVVLTTNTNNRAKYTELEHAFSENIGSYTFLVFDKTGTKATAYTINGNRTIPLLSGLNNDAVKIGVVSGGKAIIKGGLTLQALDPYIDHLDIVCQEDDGNGGKLTQQFNATDFSVRGGKFNFYVPSDFKSPAKFTFDNLYSKYGDNSYYNADNNPENHGRYFFVGSEYDLYTDNNDNAYNRYKFHKDALYTTKVACLQPGNAKYNFNNAATATGSTGTEYEEYPFSKALYRSKVNGSFTDFKFEQSEMNGTKTKTAYLFTCDETRYNIAPTTATQHVYYAFYEMAITMQKHTYVPNLAWEKVYGKTFYSANNTDIKRDAKFGLKVTTENVHDDQGDHSGYMTVTQILDYIKGRDAAAATYWQEGDVLPEGVNVGDEKTPAITKIESALVGGDDAPSRMDQILYIDARDLMSIVENQTVRVNEQGNPVVVEGKLQYDSHSVSELITNLDKNALIYLPYGSKPSQDNFAYNTVAQYGETPIFRGASNIVIQDRYPFYSKYDIQVEDGKMAKYDRKLTNQSLYGDDDQHLTIVLPFEIDVDRSGVHKNDDNEGTPFTLATMNGTKALSKNSSEDFYADGYFSPISEDSEANKPYVVTMQGTAGENDFKVHVNGALVKATPNNIGILTGENAEGKYKENDEAEEVTYNFTHKGTYTGIEIGEAAKGGAVASDTTVFYFANNYFLDSKTLIKGKTLKMLPFRSYYEYPSSAKAKMVKFRIVFGENDEDDTTGISAVQKNSTLAVIPGDGYITIMAKADSNVAIHTVNGMTVEKCNLRAGETRTVAMPSGIYVINGVKMVVK